MAKLVGFKVDDLQPHVDDALKEFVPSPKWSPKRISFELQNINSRLANAIRRTMISELQVFALDVETTNIKSNDDYILLEEFRDRINHIPISQKLPHDTKFDIEFVSKKPMSIVRSGDITINNEKKPGAFMDHILRLAQIQLGKHLVCSDIHIVQGFGYEHSMFSLVSSVGYHPTDYVDVDIVSDRGYFSTKRVALADIKKHHKSYKHKPGRPTILVVEKKSYLDHISSRDDITKYDKIIYASIPEALATNTHPKNFHLSIETLGTVTPKYLLETTCDSIAERTLRARDNWTVEKIDNVTLIHICNETNTITQLISYYIWLLVPDIPLIAQKVHHPLESKRTIKIIHPNANKIATDAVDRVIKEISQVKKLFTNV